MKCKYVGASVFLLGGSGLAGPAVAEEPVVEAWQRTANAANNIGETKIVVTGKKQKYTNRKNKKINVWVSVRGREPANVNRQGGGTIKIEGTSLNIETALEPKTYKVRFDYRKPLSPTVANARLSPIKLCNDHLETLSGKARIDFLINGKSLYLSNAYRVNVASTWVLNHGGRKRTFPKPPYSRDFESNFNVGVIIECRPLDKAAAATRENSPPPPPGRANPAPVPIAYPRATLTINPINVERVGLYMCPTKLRLRGFFETDRKFNGTAIMVGPSYLSPRKEINFSAANRTNMIATAPLSWDNTRGQLGVAGSAPYRQSRSYRFNIANGQNKVIKSAVRDIQITCKKP